MTTEIVGNLTFNSKLKNVPVANVIPLTKNSNATGHPKDQYAVMEKSAISTKTPLTQKLYMDVYVILILVLWVASCLKFIKNLRI
jgi:hypothetical protein